jgi:hypothetical protein
MATTVTIDDIVSSPVLSSNFRVFLCQHHCEENIDFLVSVRCLSGEDARSGAIDHRRYLPNTIDGVFERFVREDLNLSIDLRARIANALASGDRTPSIFAEAVVEIKTLLNQQWVAPFVKRYDWLIRYRARQQPRLIRSPTHWRDAR